MRDVEKPLTERQMRSLFTFSHHFPTAPDAGPQRHTPFSLSVFLNVHVSYRFAPDLSYKLHADNTTFGVRAMLFGLGSSRSGTGRNSHYPPFRLVSWRPEQGFFSVLLSRHRQ